MAKRVKDQQPDEVVTFCEGYKPLRDANKLLKKKGLVIKWRSTGGGDEVYIRLEQLKEKPKPR